MSEVRMIMLGWLAFNVGMLALFALLFARRMLRWHLISRLSLLGGLGVSSLFGLLLLVMSP